MAIAVGTVLAALPRRRLPRGPQRALEGENGRSDVSALAVRCAPARWTWLIVCGLGGPSHGAPGPRGAHLALAHEPDPRRPQVSANSDPSTWRSARRLAGWDRLHIDHRVDGG